MPAKTGANDRKAGLSAEERFAVNAKALYPYLPSSAELKAAEVAEKLAAGGKQVVKIDDYTTKVGGSISWRTNNPGNIGYSPLTVKYGAIGKVGGNAVFPSEEVGRTAMKALLLGPYAEKTVFDAVEDYAPGKDGNDVPAYRKFLGDNGIDLQKTVAEQVDKLQEAIIRYEGWKEGDTLVEANN